MPVRVSVVVAVYNTGEYIGPLIDSLLHQTMPPGEFEAIFVDDGSTDGTPARLDRLAAEVDNVRVVHEPNSGWPGRPRNVGTDLARGEYVFYADHDDWLGREALERMVAYADENQSDIVIGRYAGHHRGVAKALFSKSRPDATLANSPLLDSLTPHKMFRLSFLAEHQLRFPEGRRRLEDHVFVVQAYFLAKRISVLADYHCYFHIGRPDAGNAGFQQIDPAGYYGYVREVVDITLEHTEPGALRDRYLRRPLRQEMLGRLDGASFLAQDPGYQRRVFSEVRRIALETMPPSVDTGLSPPQRVRAALMREDRLDDLIAYVDHYVGVKGVARLLDLRWEDDGRLALDIEGSLVTGGEEQPWTYRQEGKSTVLTLPPLAAPVDAATVECSAALRAARMTVIARRREDSEEWPIPTDSAAEVHRSGDRAWVTYRATGRFDPRTLGGGRQLMSGIWDLYAIISEAGLSKQVRLGSTRTDEASSGRRPALLSGVAMVPYWTRPYDNLSLEVAASAKSLAGHLAPGVAGCSLVASATDGSTLRLSLPLAIDGDLRLSARIRLTRVGSSDTLDIDAGQGVVEVDAWTVAAPLPKLRAGRWRVLLDLSDVAGWDQARPIGVTLSVSPAGDSSVVDDREVRRPAPADEDALPPARALRRRLGKRAGRFVTKRRVRIRRAWLAWRKRS